MKFLNVRIRNNLMLSFFLVCKLSAQTHENSKVEQNYVTIAILAKDKAHTLPLYLSCIEKQTWPKSATKLYIRTNDNTDETSLILKNWIHKVKDLYADIYFDDTDIDPEIKKYQQHEWNCLRFKILGDIRQKSVDWALSHQSHYFVVDCDNFILPDTLEALMNTQLPIVAPYLRATPPSFYSNYHAAIDENGYFADCQLYYSIINSQVKGLIEVPVVHCSYLIRREFLDKIKYDDQSGRFEYVIFSDNARKNNIPQYFDNRKLYGRLTFACTSEEFQKEPWISEFCDREEKIASVFTYIYKNAIWGKNENGDGFSGEGSTLENTSQYRDFLQKFLHTHQIKSVVDAGCGDWEFSQHIDWIGISYTGYDVVKHVIENNSKKFQSANLTFMCENFLNLDLPAADLFLCKDVFQHLPSEQINSFLSQLQKFKYCLITNDVDQETEQALNIDTDAGGYRYIDLTKPPFNLVAEKVFFFKAGSVKKMVLLVHNPADPYCYS